MEHGGLNEYVFVFDISNTHAGSDASRTPFAYSGIVFYLSNLAFSTWAAAPPMRC